MRSFGGKLGVIVAVAAALGCGRRPLDPGEDTGSGRQPDDAAVDLTTRDAVAGVDGRDTALPLDGRRSDDGAAADARVDAVPRDDSGDGGPDAGRDAGGRPPRILSLVLDGAPWYATQSTQGIAVDAAGRVYVGDYASVFVVDGRSVSTHL